MYKYIILLTFLIPIYINLDTLHPYYYDCRYVRVTVFHVDPHLGLQTWTIDGLKGTEKYMIDSIKDRKYIHKSVGTKIEGICIEKLKPECENETDEPFPGCEPDKETRIYGR